MDVKCGAKSDSNVACWVKLSRSNLLPNIIRELITAQTWVQQLLATDLMDNQTKKK